MKYFSLYFLLTISMVTRAQTPGFITDSLDTFIEREMKRWNIPGVAVAIVKDGEVIVSKGYGVTDIENPKAVNNETLFMVASNSKAFTGTALAMLEQQGLVNLDTPIISYLPDLKLADPCATEMVSIRDMLTHRIGFQTFQGDFLHWGSNLSRTELLQRMDTHQPQYDFRNGYGYCNMGFVAAGEVIPVVTGSSWDDYIAQNIFNPLKMTRSSTTYQSIVADQNACAAHTLNRGTLTKIDYENINNLGPAASINSCVNDLAQWLIMNSMEGKYQTEQLFPESVIETATTPYNITGENRGGLYPTHFELYGLGWFMSDFNGKKMVWHDGGANGFVTTTCFLPEIDLGMVVLTNTDANWFYEALKNMIAEAYLQMPYRNISAIYHNFYVNREKAKEADIIALYEQAAADKKPALKPEKYTGNYTNPVYGNIRIALEKNELKVYFEHHPNLSATLQSLGDNRFVCTYNQSIYGIKEVSFDIQQEQVKSYTMTVESFIDYMPYTFNKL